VFNALSASPLQTRRVLQPVEVAIDAFTEETYALCRRMTTLENYRVVSQPSSDLTDELRDLSERIEKADDPALRKDLLKSRQTLQERLTKLETVSTQLDRVEAQLVGVVNRLSSVVTEVVRLQAMGPSSAEPHVIEIVNQLQRETDELHKFAIATVELRGFEV
jgi:hypothetical protein